MGGGRQWVLLGAGGHATSVAAILHRIGDHVVGTSDPAGSGTFASDAEAVAWAAAHGAAVVPAVGDGHLRAQLLIAAREAGAETPPVVAASAVLAPGVTLDDGVVVGESAVLGPESIIGAGAIVNTAAVVEHHVHVGAFAHVAPRAVLLGAVRVGTHCLVGAGAIVLPERRVGDEATVGAGAVVSEDVQPGDTVVGVPARSTRREARR